MTTIWMAVMYALGVLFIVSLGALVFALAIAAITAIVIWFEHLLMLED